MPGPCLLPCPPDYIEQHPQRVEEKEEEVEERKHPSLSCGYSAVQILVYGGKGIRIALPPGGKREQQSARRIQAGQAGNSDLDRRPSNTRGFPLDPLIAGE